MDDFGRSTDKFDLALTSSSEERYSKSVTCRLSYLWKTVAAYTYLAGQQSKSAEGRVSRSHFKSDTSGARDHFTSAFGTKPPGREVLEKLTSVAHFKYHHAELLSQSFITLAASLGQAVAGGEKLL